MYETPTTLPVAAAAFEKLSGPLVPILTAFDDNDRLDLESTTRWVSHLIDRGIRLFWTTHGTSHYMCLTDDEIVALNRAVAETARGRAAFIASTPYHWPVATCAQFMRTAADWGVDMVKPQIDWRAFTPRDDMVMEYYQAIHDASPLPLLAYTWGSPGIKLPLLRRILELPKFVGLKNDTGDYVEQVEYLRFVREVGADGRFTPITGGTMISFLHGWHFGARTFATGTAMYAPEEVIAFYEHIKGGLTRDAVALIEQYEAPLLREFVPMGHWSSFHSALHHLGLFASPRVRFPVRTLSPQEQQHVAKQLRGVGLL